MKNYFYLLILSSLLFVSCQQEEKPPYPLPDNAKALIAGDSAKTWKLASRFNDKTRMNMGDCFLSYRQTYQTDMKMFDNNGENSGCGETLQAGWEFAKDKKGNYYVKVNSEQLPELMNIEKDYKLFKILHLSDEQMVVQFYHKQFSDRKTKITDIYVPEHASVEDRDFHW